MTSLENPWKTAALQPFWLDNPARPEPRPALTGHVSVDLLVVGAGLTGLWTALRAVEREPGTRVLLIEADRIAEHAAGRNGGFCDASITHGDANGRARWPEEFETLRRLGDENLDEIEKTIARYGIDCGFVRGGTLTVATRQHEVDALDSTRPGFLDAAAVREHIDSPTFLAGRHTNDSAMIDPARLAWGLARAAEQQGVTIAEGTALRKLFRAGRRRVAAETDAGSIDAGRVVLATNVFPNPLRRLRLPIVPVYDYSMVTEPLSTEQLAAIRWNPAVGLTDSGNQFHYSRITPDNRILWGGYDAIYHFGRDIDPAYNDRPETYGKLAEQFAETFPQLAGVRFTHRWAGVIDTSTRFCAFFGTALRGRVAYTAGFTGLGVGASRFAADTVLDLLSGKQTERTRLKMVRTQPIPFPPEPLAWLGIQITRWSLARADVTGKRNLWLRTLDALGLGFDS